MIGVGALLEVVMHSCIVECLLARLHRTFPSPQSEILIYIPTPFCSRA
jgi:hypothetical protein